MSTGSLRAAAAIVDVGMWVALMWEPLSDGRDLPMFRPA